MINRIKNAVSFYANEVKRSAHSSGLILGNLRRLNNVAYMGWVGYNNLGDEILYDAHVALFPRLKMLPYQNNKLARVCAASRGGTLFRAGWLGGGTLINQSTSWLGMIERLQEEGCPVYCFGTGVTQSSFRAGHEKTSIEEWVKVLETFAFVGIRGPYSKKILNEAGFYGARVIGDTALALASPDYRPRDVRNRVIGLNFGLIKEGQIWGSADSYTESIVASIQQLIDRGYTIRLLPVWDKDLPSNRALVKRINDPRCTLAEDCYKTLTAYNAELEKCGMFIGQKLHATIMATMLRIPSIMIEYQPKCRDYMASVGMEKWVIKTSECNPELLLDTVQRLSDQSKAIQQELNKHIVRYRTLQYRLAAKIEDDLLR